MRIFSKIKNKQLMMLATAHAALMFSGSSFASNNKKISSVFSGVESEAKIILPIIMYLSAAFGAVLVVVAIWTAISAKRNREPLTWQVWGMIGGGMLTIAGAIVGMVAGSLGVTPTTKLGIG